MIQLTVITSGLHTGGAEMMLYKVFTRLNRDLFRLNVISLIEPGQLAEKIRGSGIEVHVLGMRRGVPDPLKIVGLVRRLRRNPPNLIQTWMYHADLVGGLAAMLAGGIPVVWGVRHSNLEKNLTKRMTLWTARTCGLLARRIPIRIVCNSESSQESHRKLGYPVEKIEVIPNGFDLDVFHPDPEARLAVREELGLPADAAIVGMIGRFDILKDHENFFRSAGILHRKWPDVHFLLCGEGITWKNGKLAGWIEAAGIRSHCHLLGLRSDVPRLMAALDVAVLSSRGEAFPNVVGEAMSCEVPCVVTDVGDAARIVGDTGRIVPPNDPDSLAEAISEMVGMGTEARHSLGVLARKRVSALYSLDSIVKRYENLYLELCETIVGQGKR